MFFWLLQVESSLLLHCHVCQMGNRLGTISFFKRYFVLENTRKNFKIVRYSQERSMAYQSNAAAHTRNNFKYIVVYTKNSLHWRVFGHMDQRPMNYVVVDLSHVALKKYLRIG